MSLDDQNPKHDLLVMKDSPSYEIVSAGIRADIRPRYGYRERRNYMCTQTNNLTGVQPMP